ncbi:2,3-bisphosphoglycerate-independent phosphoglycerate mutase [candidate division KSB1 bacterium]
MDIEGLLPEIIQTADSKIVLFVIDGIGGLPRNQGGQTELEAARTPNLDQLANSGTTGLIDPVSPGVTPGSGPGHLSLFGYDPMKYQVGRGILSALGVGFEIGPDDLAARINFCSVDLHGTVLDRRAGRISTETCERLCKKLATIHLPDVQLFVLPEKEHRACVVFRGKDIFGEISDTDPQAVGVPSLPIKPLNERSKKAAGIITAFLEEVKDKLRDEDKANMVLMRGFAKHVPFPLFPERYLLKAAAVAGYPMYRGVSRLTGMEIIPCGPTFADQMKALKDNYQAYDFFYLHYKTTDSRGEDGDYDAKVREIETADAAVPEILDLNPDVLVVTGDHSTPAPFSAHSWHPVPLLLKNQWVLPDRVKRFGERDCINGGLGRLPATAIMPLALAHAGRLAKFGA